MTQLLQVTNHNQGETFVAPEARDETRTSVGRKLAGMFKQWRESRRASLRPADELSIFQTEEDSQPANPTETALLDPRLAAATRLNAMLTSEEVTEQPAREVSLATSALPQRAARPKTDSAQAEQLDAATDDREEQRVLMPTMREDLIARPKLPGEIKSEYLRRINTPEPKETVAAPEEQQVYVGTHSREYAEHEPQLAGKHRVATHLAKHALEAEVDAPSQNPIAAEQGEFYQPTHRADPPS